MYNTAPEFFSSIFPMLQEVLQKNQYEAFYRTMKVQIKFEKYWENDLHKLTKDKIGEHCFLLFGMLKIISKELIIKQGELKRANIVKEES